MVGRTYSGYGRGTSFAKAAAKKSVAQMKKGVVVKVTTVKGKGKGLSPKYYKVGGGGSSSSGSSQFRDATPQEAAKADVELATKELQAKATKAETRTTPKTAGEIVRESREFQKRYPQLDPTSIQRSIATREAGILARKEITKELESPEKKTAGEVVRRGRQISQTYNVPSIFAQRAVSEAQAIKRGEIKQEELKIFSIKEVKPTPAPSEYREYKPSFTQKVKQTISQYTPQPVKGVAEDIYGFGKVIATLAKESIPSPSLEKAKGFFLPIAEYYEDKEWVRIGGRSYNIKRDAQKEIKEYVGGKIVKTTVAEYAKRKKAQQSKLFRETAPTIASYPKERPVETAITIGTLGYGKLPSIGKKALDVYFLKEGITGVRGSKTVSGKVVSGTVGLVSATSLGSKIIKPLATRLRLKYKPVETSPLGEMKIKKVKGVGDIGLIPERGYVPKVDPKAALKQYPLSLKQVPTAPKFSTKAQKEFYEITKKEGGVFTGSFSQKSLARKGRPYGDIDVAAIEPAKVASAVEKESKLLRVKKTRITDSPKGEFDIYRAYEKKTGKLVGDIDPLKFAEEGLLAKYPTTQISGAKFGALEARYQAKVTQLGRPLSPGKRTKVLKDISLLSGGKVDTSAATFTGPYGYSRAEQAAYIGKTGPITTSARDLFGKVFKRKTTITEGEGGYGLFLTPFDIKTGQAQTRVSRLGVAQEEASLLDIFSGESLTFKRQKPQIVVFPEQKIGKTVKPFGYPSSELEVFLPPETIIKRAKTPAITLIKGKPVEIITAEVLPMSKVLSKETRTKVKQLQLKNISKESMSSKELKELSKSLGKETGIYYDYPVGKYVSPSKIVSQPLALGRTISKPNAFRFGIPTRTTRSYYGFGQRIEYAPQYKFDSRIQPTKYEQDYSITSRYEPRAYNPRFDYRYTSEYKPTYRSDYRFEPRADITTPTKKKIIFDLPERRRLKKKKTTKKRKTKRKTKYTPIVAVAGGLTKGIKLDRPSFSGFEIRG